MAATSAAYVDLETKPLRTNTLLITDHISVEDKTTTYTNLRVGIKEGSVFLPLEEQKNPAAAEVFWTKSNLQFVEHERVCCRLTGCTSADVIEVTIQGRLYYLEA
jgi:hypothetical protein